MDKKGLNTDITHPIRKERFDGLGVPRAPSQPRAGNRSLNAGDRALRCTGDTRRREKCD